MPLYRLHWRNTQTGQTGFVPSVQPDEEAAKKACEDRGAPPHVEHWVEKIEHGVDEK